MSDSFMWKTVDVFIPNLVELSRIVNLNNLSLVLRQSLFDIRSVIYANSSLPRILLRLLTFCLIFNIRVKGKYFPRYFVRLSDVVFFRQE